MMFIGQQTVQATSDDGDVFKLQVTLEDVDSLTGELKIIVYGNQGVSQTQIIDPFEKGYAGDYKLPLFKLPAYSVHVGSSYSLCVHSQDYDVPDNCITGDNTPAKIDEVSLQVPSGIGRPNDHVSKDTTYYDDDGNVVQEGDYVPSVYQGDDSENTNKNQGSGVVVTFGDDSDNNNVNIDQRSTFADVIKDLVPKVGSAVKNTAREILN